MIEMVIDARRKDLGGFEVGRVLPFHARRMVGPFIFLDQMGPAEFAPGAESINVRPHPHIGLSTLTYLFEGEIMHRDNLGYTQAIRPGEVNWMTAGKGIVVAEDGTSLIVADYSSGLHRVSLTDGAVTRLSAPADAVLVGIDGLIPMNGGVLALQNGVQPHRVLRLTLSATQTAVIRVEVLAANLDDLNEPSTGLALNGDLVFVSRTQWGAFDGEGQRRVQDPAPTVISRLTPNQGTRP